MARLRNGYRAISWLFGRDVGDIWHKVKQVVTMVRTIQERHEKAHPESEANETAVRARPDWCAIYQVGMRADKRR